MNSFKANRISKSEFIKLNENDVMFITNPGRMGDEDGLTFIIKNGNELSIYRVDGFIYKNKDEVDITLDDVSKQFPKWRDAWKNGDNKKYKYLYMGFGNGLSVDNRFYKDFEPYLNNLVEKDLDNNPNEKRESLKYVAIYSVWIEAIMKMINDKKYVLK